MTRTRVALGGTGIIAALALGAGQVATASGRPARRLAPAVAVAVGRCQEQTLRITLAQASPGADHHGYVLLFHNRGAACTLKGYPGVDGFSAQGHRLVSARRTKSGYLGGVAPGRPIPLVHLPQGRTASAMLEWVDGPVPGLSCSAVRSLQITPPGAVSSVRRTPTSLRSERLCDVQIHPVVPGTTGQDA